MTGRARAVFGASLPWLTLLLSGCPAAPEPACPEGQVQDVDSEECVPERCGTGAWGLLERTGETVHVAPWGDDGWDGSQEWPYRTIQKGADEAEHLVAVAAGAYLENLALDGDHDGVEIAGRCPELVVVDGSGEDQPGVWVTRGQIGLEGLTVTGGTMGVRVQRQAFGATVDLRIEDSLLEANAGVGLFVADIGASVHIVESTVRENTPASDPTLGKGQGIVVLMGGQLEAVDCLLDRNRVFGLEVLGAGSAVDLSGVTVRATQPDDDETLGRGVDVYQGAVLQADDLIVEASHEVGLRASGSGTEVDLQDASIRDTRPDAEGAGGHGLQVSDGAALEARSVVLEANAGMGVAMGGGATDVELEEVTVRGGASSSGGIELLDGAQLLARDILIEGVGRVGLHVADPGTCVVLEDSAIRGTLPTHEEEGGRGISVEDGASLYGSRLVLENNHDLGLFSNNAGTLVELDDVSILDTQPLPDGTKGGGLSAQDRAGVVARGLLLDGNHGIGLAVRDPGTSVVVEEGTISATKLSPEGVGRGIQVWSGAALEARWLVLDGNEDDGLWVGGAGTTVLLEDVTVQRTHPSEEGPAGRGISVQDGGSLVARRLVLEQNRDTGLQVVQPGTSVELEDVTIRDTRPDADGRSGRGVEVGLGARLAATGLRLEGNRDVGLLAVHPGTTVELHDVSISHTGRAHGSAGGFGIGVQDHASVVAFDLLDEDNEGPGIALYAGGILEAYQATLLRNGFAGAVVLDDSELVLRDSTCSGSRPDDSEGGGVGVFAWHLGIPPHLDLRSVSFSELPGPALYLRGPGRYLVRDCQVTAAGSTPRLPGGVLALEGAKAWHEVGDTGFFTGLAVQGGSFDDLPSDAIRLDSSSVTLDVSPDTGAPNTFGTVGGVPVLWQRCDGVAPPEVLDGSTPAPDCEPVPRTLGQALEYDLWVSETAPVD